VGQTFRDDTTMLAQMNPGSPDAGNAFFLYCDSAGALRLRRKGMLPGRVLVRLRASAPYANFGTV